MAENKTQARRASALTFLSKVEASRHEDCLKLVEMMKRATGAEPVMWGPSIVGFGDHHYLYASGREGDFFQIGFSPRKSDLTIYLMGGLARHQAALAKLGSYRRGGGCLYLKRLADVEAPVLAEMMSAAVKALRAEAKSRGAGKAAGGATASRAKKRDAAGKGARKRGAAAGKRRG